MTNLTQERDDGVATGADRQVGPGLILIGYWAGPYTSAGWPDPRDFVDPAWDEDERIDVANYLTHAPECRWFMGLSECRFCGQPNGSAECSDGVFIWPEGLAHYVTEHQVRLPERFVRHALATVRSLEDRLVDTDWWRGQQRLP